MRAASRAAFAKHDSVYLRGVVRHQAYALALITYGQGAARARGLVVTLVEEAGGWKRTNALSADATMGIVWTAFSVGELAAR